MSVDKISIQPTLHTLETTNIDIGRSKSEFIENHQSNTVSLDKENLEKVVQSINDFIKPSNTHLKFVLHEELNEYYVTVVDNLTNETVKEIPSKKLLDFYSAMTEYIGLMFDKKI